MASRILLPLGAALAALGRVAWQIVFLLGGDSLAGNARGFLAALGLAIVAWAAWRPEERTGPLAAGAALTLAADAWVVAANVDGLGRWMLPFSITMLGLLALSWTAFTTARGAWGPGAARASAAGASVLLAGSLAWIPLNLAADGIPFLAGTALAVVGYGALLAGLLAEAGVRLPKVALKRRRAGA